MVEAGSGSGSCQTGSGQRSRNLMGNQEVYCYRLAVANEKSLGGIRWRPAQ